MKNVRREDWETLKPTVYGWGINDVNYVLTRYAVVDGKSKQVWICPYYDDWRGILERCYSEKLHKKQHYYAGCTVAEEWKYLSNFIKWVDSQPNRDWVNCEPDKDLLVRGNKHYSPDTVVYIQQSLNAFITDSAKARGPLMIGVTPNLTRTPYKTLCKNPFTKLQEYLGVFSSELAAHLSWKAKKHEHACELADLQDDPRVADALRQRYAPDKDWTRV